MPDCLIIFWESAVSDGKLYDAYVSYLHHNNLCSSHAENFVMHILPEVLEGLHGYKLFIRGRDNLPGEGKIQMSCLGEYMCT